MAIRDLLWACPECGEARALASSGDGSRCISCGMIFRRERGSRITGSRPGGAGVSRPANEWVDLLPEMAAVVDAEVKEPEGAVEARFAVGTDVVDKKKEYLGRIERFGPVMRGVLRIETAGVRFDPREADGRNRADRFWSLDALTAIQASSRTLQLKFRREPVISFRFPGGSLRFWELRLQYAVQSFYERTGRGRIREYQPRIVAESLS